MLDKPDTEIEKAAFAIRATIFFQQSSINALLTFCFGSTIAVCAAMVGSPPLHTSLWWLALSFTAFLLHIYTPSNPQKKSLKEQKKFLFIQLILGLLMALVFFSLLFVLKNITHISGYYIFLGIMAATYLVILVSQLTFPDYYIAFGVMTALASLIYLFFYHEADAIYGETIFIMGLAIATYKGKFVSDLTIETVYHRAKLEIEKRHMQKTQAVLQKRSLHDELTKINNRRYLEEFFIQADTHVMVIFIDLNGFKLINDTFGHQNGDYILKFVALKLLYLSPENSAVARLSGDEFCCITPRNQPESCTQEVATRIKQSLNVTVKDHRQTVNLSASVGTANYPEDGATLSQVLSAADLNMYKNKERHYANLTTAYE